MSSCLSLNPYKLIDKNNISNEENHSLNTLENKDVVSIFTSNFANSVINTTTTTTTTNNNTIRRTMSFDMSSEKWIEDKEFSIKRVNSVEKLQTLGEQTYQNDVNDYKGGAFEDIWKSILSQKKLVEAESNDTALTPYVHPLMKRASSLSEKSLEICTESLGSETGSDVFSCMLPDPGQEQDPDLEPEPKKKVEEVKNDEAVRVDNNYTYNCNYYSHGFSNTCHSKKVVDVGAAQRSFPPPLTSLVDRDGGSDFHMRTRREGGRLVVEAVSVQSKNQLCARRQDGRLLLTLDSGDDVQEMLDNDEDEEEIGGDEGENSEVEKTLALSRTSTTNINVTRRLSTTMTMSKLVELGSAGRHYLVPSNSNRTIIKTFGEGGEEEIKDRSELESARQTIVAQSLQPLPRLTTTTTATAMLDAYEYYWLQNDNTQSALVDVLKLLARKQTNNFSDSVSVQVIKDKNKRVNKFLLEHNTKVGAPKQDDGEYLVPILRDCRDTKSSLFFWEPYCIATS